MEGKNNPLLSDEEVDVNNLLSDEEVEVSPKQPNSSQGAKSGFQGNAPLAKPNGLSDFTGKPISTPTSPSVNTNSVGAKKITPNQDLALKSLAFNKKEAIRKAQEAPHEEVPLDADQRYEHINLLEQRKNAVNSLYSATERVAQNQYKEVQDLSNKLNDASAKIDELVKSGNRQAAIELQAQVKPLLDEYNSKSYQLKKSGYKLESLKNRLAETDKQMIDISEGQGGLTNQWQALNAGINQLTASILRTPQTVYNTILAGQNKLAEATGLPISAPYQTEGYLESAAKYFDKNADAYHKVIEKKKTQDNYDIISLAKNGDYAKAINLLGENIVESAPVTGGLAMASATGVGAVPLFLGGTSVFAAQNFQENKDKGISVEKNLLNSWTNATLEQIFEETGTLAIVRYGKDLFTKAGKEGAEEAAKTVWDKAYGYALKKLFPIGAAGAEGLSEAETTFTQNYVNTIMGMNDEFNAKQKQIENSNLSESEKEDAQQELYKETLFKGVPDAFITGAGMGAVLGAGTKEGYTAIDDKKREELKQAQKKYDNLATTLSDPTIPKEAKDVIKQQADLEAEKIQKIAEEDDLEHAEKLTPKEYTNVISVQAEIDKLENSLQSVTNPDAKAVVEAKIDDLVAKKHSILGIERPIKYTSSTSDRYGYVNENGVKRDLTKEEFENYESKVNMEQPMEAAPTEESKGVGEDTQAFTTDEKGKSEPIELSVEPSKIEPPSDESKVKEVDAEIEKIKRDWQEKLSNQIVDATNIRNANTKEELDKSLMKAFQEDTIQKALNTAGMMLGKDISSKYYNKDYSFKNEVADAIEDTQKSQINKINAEYNAELDKLKSSETDPNTPSKQNKTNENNGTKKGATIFSEILATANTSNIKEKLFEIYKITDSLDRDKFEEDYKAYGHWLSDVKPKNENDIKDIQKKIHKIPYHNVPYDSLGEYKKIQEEYKDKLIYYSDLKDNARVSKNWEELDKIKKDEQEYIKSIRKKLATLESNETESTTLSEESPVDLEKNKTSEKTENKEAVVPSEEGAMGEDTSEGEQPQAEVVEPTEGSKVEVIHQVKSNKDVSKAFNRIIKDEHETNDYGIHGLLADIGAEYDEDNDRIVFNDTRSGTGKLRLSKKDFINDILSGKLEKEIPFASEFILNVKSSILDELGLKQQEVIEPSKKEADSKFKQLNTKENAVQESKAESVLPREQGEVREARSEREGVGQSEQGQEPTKASEEEVEIQAGSAGEGVQDYKGIFNPKKTGISGLDDLLNDNGYQYFYKGVSGEVVMMSPDEYLKKVRTDITRTDRDEGVYEEKKERIIEGINRGDKINMPYLSLKEDGKAHKQEGRNRATVAKEMGEKLIPVFIEKDISFDDKIAKGQEYINSAIKNGATTKEEVISKLEKQGLHRDAIRFIDNNFDNKTVENLLGKPQTKSNKESEEDVEFTAKGGNKVVDRKGEPIEVYHGALIPNFNKLSFKKRGFGTPKAVFFTSVRDNAKKYSLNDRDVDEGMMNGTTEFEYGSGGAIYTANIKMKNPLVIDAKGKKWNDLRNIIGGKRVYEVNDAVNAAISLGYDGLIVKNVYDSHTSNIHDSILATTYAVFSEEQIKIIIKNKAKSAEDLLGITQSGIKAEPKVESVPEKVQKEAKVEKEYKEAISKKSERAKNIAKENFINDNFDKIVSQMMLNNKIKRKC